MIVSIFEVAGPIMVGPSSSHTAGAARLSRIASLLVEKPYHHVSFGLHGSFARTYHGHGTDLALVAGVLGIRQEDEEMKRSFEIAAERGITYDFHEIDLGDAHENSVSISFTLEDESVFTVTGSSVGGGRVLITDIDGIDTALSLDSPTMLVTYQERTGMLSRICSELAYSRINIAGMKCSRQSKGGMVCVVLEADTPLPDMLREDIMQIRGVQNAVILNPSEA